jgi:hypothetical protein
MSFEPLDGTRSCDNCGGDFLPGDMDGDHCLECSDSLFGEPDEWDGQS